MEVFPTLDLSDELKGLLEFVRIDRVTLNRDRDFMRIFLESEKLIFKKHIFELEQAIMDQLFSDVKMTVKIIEKFHLSKQYTPQNLMPVYESSILLELKNYNALLYSLMHDSKKVFTAPDTLCLEVPDTVIADGKEQELLGILEKVFCERCGLDFHVSTKRVEPPVSRRRKNADLELEQEVAAIAKQYTAAKGEETRQKTETAEVSGEAKSTEKKTTVPKEVPQKPKAEETAGKKMGEKRNTFFSGDRFGQKKSDDPDVIYGRDVEGEPMEIEQITGEIGGVTIRGQVLSFEARELRIAKTLLIFNITDFTDTITVKMFVKNEQAEELKGIIKEGAFFKLSGVTTIDRYDSQLSIGNVTGMKKIPDFREKRVDTYPEKRVELHCHTKMSDMDGVSEVSAIFLHWRSPITVQYRHSRMPTIPSRETMILR